MGDGTWTLSDFRIGSALTLRDFKNDPIDMYNMSGLVSHGIMYGCTDYALNNLADASDTKAQNIHRELIGIVSHDLFGFTEADGVILESGSRANEVALSIARHETRRRKVLLTNMAHRSVIDACKRLQMEIITLDVSPTDFTTIDPSQLKKVLNKHGGLIGTIIVTGGSTQTGGIETFIQDPSLQEFIQEHNVWVHIDAAYGGFIHNLVGEEPSLLQKICHGKIHSIATDPYKFVGVPGCSTLLISKNSNRDFRNEVSYFTKGNMTAFGTTRSAFPASVALQMMKTLGMPSMQELAEEVRSKARDVAEQLSGQGVKLLAPITSGVIPIALKSEKEIKEVSDRLLASGFRVSPLHIAGKEYDQWGIRIVITPKPELTNEVLTRFVDQFR